MCLKAFELHAVRVNLFWNSLTHIHTHTHCLLSRAFGGAKLFARQIRHNLYQLYLQRENAAPPQVFARQKHADAPESYINFACAKCLVRAGRGLRSSISRRKCFESTRGKYAGNVSATPFSLGLPVITCERSQSTMARACDVKLRAHCSEWQARVRASRFRV